MPRSHPIADPHKLWIHRDPMHGARVSGLDGATYQARRLLADRGFASIPGTTDLAYTGPQDGSAFLQMRQTVAALRGLGHVVDADPAFDYTSPPSPLSAAAGEDTLVVTGFPARRHDVAVGRHRDLGVIATNPQHDPAIAAQLLDAGFEPITEDLLALSDPQRDTVARASEAVARLRDAGLHVVTDLLFEPRPEDPAQYTSTNPYAAALAQALDPERADRSRPADPRLPAADHRDPGSATAPEDAEGPDADVLLAKLASRAATLAALKRLLDAVTSQLRGDPTRIDVTQVNAALDQATTALDGVGRDLMAISAQAVPRAPAPRRTNPRVQAALATSALLTGVTRQAVVEERSVPAPVDPRLAYAAHR